MQDVAVEPCVESPVAHEIDVPAEDRLEHLLQVDQVEDVSTLRWTNEQVWGRAVVGSCRRVAVLPPGLA